MVHCPDLPSEHPAGHPTAPANVVSGDLAERTPQLGLLPVRSSRITTALRRCSGLRSFPSHHKLRLTAQIAPTASPGMRLEHGFINLGLCQKLFEPGVLLLKLSQPSGLLGLYPPGTAAASGGGSAILACFEHVFSCKTTSLGDRLTRKIGLEHGVSINISPIN
jgi:hypothetical protein